MVPTSTGGIRVPSTVNLFHSSTANPFHSSTANLFHSSTATCSTRVIRVWHAGLHGCVAAASRCPRACPLSLVRP
jgi:hypothetical protein